MQLKIVEVKAESEGRIWDRYVLDHPQANGYHLIAWRRVIEKAFGHRTFYLIAMDEVEEARGVLPLVLLASRFFGRCLVSLPFVNYGGLLVDSVGAQEALLQAAVALAKKLKAAHIELRQQAGLELGWRVKQHKVAMRLELPGRFEVLWSNFPSKLRSQIRRAQKEGLTVRIGGGESLDDFYQVFSRNMRDLGTPVYGRSFFETIVETFPKETRICTVYLNNHAVAAGLLYGFRTTVEVPWASSDQRYNHLAPNMLLYSSMLEYACREAFQIFDFGRSTLGSGTCRFKEQWGALPIPLAWQYWTAAPGELPDISPKNPKYELAIQIWKRLPIRIANRLGPSLVRNIP